MHIAAPGLAGQPVRCCARARSDLVAGAGFAFHVRGTSASKVSRTDGSCTRSSSPSASQPRHWPDERDRARSYGRARRVVRGWAICGCTQRPVSAPARCCPRLSVDCGPNTDQYRSRRVLPGQVQPDLRMGLRALGWAPRGRPPSPWLGRHLGRTPGCEGSSPPGRAARPRAGANLGRATVTIVAHQLPPGPIPGPGQQITVRSFSLAASRLLGPSDIPVVCQVANGLDVKGPLQGVGITAGQAKRCHWSVCQASSFSASGWSSWGGCMSGCSTIHASRCWLG